MYHKQLVIHITSKLQEGLPFHLIEADLLKDGWDLLDIHEAYKYAMFPSRLNRFSISRFLHSEIPSMTSVSVIMFFIIFAGIFVFLKKPVYNYTVNIMASAETAPINFSYGEQPALSDPVFFERMKAQFISDKTNFVEVNLSTMEVNAYKNGSIALHIPVKTKGREGSWWETPAGLYKINTKEPTHFSGIGHVYMPWSMNFQGNFFIHGWPYYEDGGPVATTYSGGCIRLDTEDAKKLYDLVDVGTPILVYKDSFKPDGFTYSDTPPAISARSSIAVDINNNHVFLQNNSQQRLPIASLTKLMTALIATEYINLDAMATVPQEAVVHTSKPRLTAGMNISIYQLLFPLLMESSNEAAETIARYYGRDQFIKHMNEKATSLGMTDTVFADPSGSSENNISTAEDLLMLARYIYNNRSFIFNITSGKIKSSAYGANQFSDIGNFNNFADDLRFIGGKVGKTTAAKETELSVFNLPMGGVSSSTRPIVMIILGSENSKNNIISILNYISNNFQGK